MGYLDRTMRNSIATLLIYIVRRNYDGIIRVFKKVGVVEETLDERRFKLELMGLLEPYFSRSLEGLPLGDAVNQVIHLSLRYRVRFPPELYLLGRALVLVDSDLRSLDPQLNVIEVVAPFALKVMKSRRSPRAIRESMEEEMEVLKEGIRTLPHQVLQALQRFNRGDVRVTMVHQGLEDLVEGMERNSLRLTVTLLFILFMVLGTWTMGLPWSRRIAVGGFPILPLVSYGAALGMAFLLVGSVLFRRR
jgi:ubiquinone biosynthesis protein